MVIACEWQRIAPMRTHRPSTGIGVADVCRSIGADSLGYISEAGMIAATNQPAAQLCTACFTGTYPIELPSHDKLGKGLLEMQLPMDLASS